MRIVDHCGSGNHGCEALLRTILTSGKPEHDVLLLGLQVDVHKEKNGAQFVHHCNEAN